MDWAVVHETIFSKILLSGSPNKIFDKFNFVKCT